MRCTLGYSSRSRTHRYGGSRLKNLSLASHFGHATVFGFERFDVLIEGVMAAFLVITTLPPSAIVLVKNEEEILLKEFSRK